MTGQLSARPDACSVSPPDVPRGTPGEASLRVGSRPDQPRVPSGSAPECAPENNRSGISLRLVAEECALRGALGRPRSRASDKTTARMLRRDLQRPSEGAAGPAVGDLGKTTCQRLPSVLSGSSAL